jgi:hypothetical protein
MNTQRLQHAIAHSKSIVTVHRAAGEFLGLGSVLPSGSVLAHLGHELSSAPLQVRFWNGVSRPVQLSQLKDRRALWVSKENVSGELQSTERVTASFSQSRLVADGTSFRCFCFSPKSGRLSFRDFAVDSVDVLAPGVCIYRFEESAPSEAAGSPMLSFENEFLGVVMVAKSKGHQRVFGLPARDLHAMVGVGARTDGASQAEVEQRTSEHPLSLLDGSTVEGLVAVNSALVGAIQIGAPAYNKGEIEACFRMYSQTALKLIEARADCPGVQRALRDGLVRAQSMKEAPLRAWAMRDTFDGLIKVINRFFESAPAYSKTRGPQSLN